MTRAAISHELRDFGLNDGAVVCAHVSLSRIGYVCGGQEALIDALLDATGTGTLMMPSFSGELSDPAEWRHPAVPRDWIDPIRAAMPPFDPQRTPARLVGTVAELFRNRPGTMRSPHPQSSFVAHGAQAPSLVASHALDFRFGPSSPLGKLAALDGSVVLLGAGQDRASFIYLAQVLAGIGKEIPKSAPMLIGGRSKWVKYRDIAVDNRLVSTGVKFLVAEGVAKTGVIGDAPTIRFGCRAALAALLDWRWRDTGIPIEFERDVTSLPSDWSLWLK